MSASPAWSRTTLSCPTASSSRRCRSPASRTKVRAAIKSKFGRTLTMGRLANLTKPINGRAPCHYCGPCERGCVTHSYFNAAFTTVADALKTGKCTHIPNAMVYQVMMDKATNKARGVTYVDRITRETREVRAKTVVLCAQALESTRILLNSAKDGLGNSSGTLGEYLMDHMWVAGGAAGEFPDMPGKPSLNTARRPGGPYVIRFRNTAKRRAPQGFRARLRLPGRQQARLHDGRAGLWPGVQGRREERPVDDGPGRLRRVPAVQAQSRHVEQERHRRLRHPRAAHRRRLGREREER